MLKENMILCGVWFGETKPFICLFTKPILKSLKKMEDIGIEYEIGSVKYNTKAFLICGTADLPAKSMVLDCNQFNGENSCVRCLLLERHMPISCICRQNRMNSKCSAVNLIFFFMNHFHIF